MWDQGDWLDSSFRSSVHSNILATKIERLWETGNKRVERLERLAVDFVGWQPESIEDFTWAKKTFSNQVNFKVASAKNKNLTYRFNDF